MFEKLCDNLNLLMTEMHISADELARRTGLPASTIKKIRNRYNPNPTLATLLPLAQFFSVPLGQLVGDEPLSKNRIREPHQQTIDTIRYIPILTWEESINWPSTITQPHTSITTEYEYSTNAFALIVEEIDWDNLAKGTALLIDPSLKTEHRDFVLVYKKGQQSPTLKQALYDEGQLYLKSMLYGNNIVAFTSEHQLLGIVVEYKKHLKKVTKIIEIET